MGKILIIRGGAIGDFVLTLPVFTALRQNLPQARLEVLGYAHIATLALAGGLVDAVRSIEAGSLAGFFARHGTLAPELTDYFKSFSIVLSYLYDPDEIFRANVALCSKAQFIQGPHRPDETKGLLASQVFLQPLERLAIFDADPTPRLALPEPPNRGAPTKPRLAVHPGSGSESKNWPLHNWCELLQKIGGDFEILLISGEAEGGRIVLDSLRAEPLERAHNLPLPELATRLAQCDAFIGHDSGISHLAAAVGLSGLVLWGPSTEHVWRPPSPKVVVLRDPAGLPGLTVERVRTELHKLIQLPGG